MFTSVFSQMDLSSRVAMFNLPPAPNKCNNYASFVDRIGFFEIIKLFDGLDTCRSYQLSWKNSSYFRKYSGEVAQSAKAHAQLQIERKLLRN